MMCVEYVASKETKEPLDDDINISKRIAKVCELNGLFVRPIGHLDVMSPPLTLSMKQSDFIVNTLGNATEEVTKDLLGLIAQQHILGFVDLRRQIISAALIGVKLFHQALMRGLDFINGRSGLQP